MAARNIETAAHNIKTAAHNIEMAEDNIETADDNIEMADGNIETADVNIEMADDNIKMADVNIKIEGGFMIENGFVILAPMGANYRVVRTAGGVLYIGKEVMLLKRKTTPKRNGFFIE